MTKASLRVALMAIRDCIAEGKQERALEMLDALVDGDGPKPRGTAKTGAQRTAEWRARNGEGVTSHVTKSDVTVTSPSSQLDNSLSGSGDQRSDLKNGKKEQESPTLAPLQLFSGTASRAREVGEVPRCDVTKPKNERSRHVTEVFEHWVAVMAKAPQTKLTSDRRSKISARLEEGYSVADLKSAVDGCRRSAWHMGENQNGRAYNDIELICRTGRHVENHLEFLTKPIAVRLKGAPMPVSSAEDFAAENDDFDALMRGRQTGNA